MKKTKLKHRTRKFISFALAVCLLTGMLSVTASAFTENKEGYAGLYNKIPSSNGSGYTYRFLSANTIAITDYNGYDTEVTIPSKIDGYTVTGVENMDTSHIKKIVMPDTVTYIGEYAFGDYNDSVPLEEIVLSKNLKSIGPSAFRRCYDLKSIDIPKSVTEVGYSAFSGCSSLENVSINSEIDLTEGVFSSVPAVNNIYDDWLYNENGSDFFIWNGWLYGYKGNSKNPVIPSGVYGIDDYLFRNSDITGITIPEGVKYIGYGAFQNCTALKSVKLPNSLKKIGGEAFGDCTALSSVTFGSGLKSIEYEGFGHCEALKKVVLPEGLEKLDSAFYGCENLENITFPSTLSEIDLDSIYYTKWYANMADGAPLYCGGVFLGFKNDSYGLSLGPSYTVKSGTKTVNIKGYIGKITKFNFPDSVKSFTFSGYNKTGYKLTSLTVPESVDYVDIESMYDLKTLKLPTTESLKEAVLGLVLQLKALLFQRAISALKLG